MNSFVLAFPNCTYEHYTYFICHARPTSYITSGFIKRVQPQLIVVNGNINDVPPYSMLMFPVLAIIFIRVVLLSNHFMLCLQSQGFCRFHLNGKNIHLKLIARTILLN